MLSTSDTPNLNFTSIDAEKQWIVRINAGDKKAFETMVRTYGGKLCRFASHLIRSKAVAEEIVQEVFCNVWDSREQWQPKQTIQSYLYTAVRNQAIGFLRHRRFETSWYEELEMVEEQEGSLEDQIQASDFSQAVQNAIQRLPPRCKIIFRLHREDGLTYAQIAQILDISPKTVKAHVGRALKLLRTALADYLPVLSSLMLLRDSF